MSKSEQWVNGRYKNSLFLEHDNLHMIFISACIEIILPNSAYHCVMHEFSTAPVRLFRWEMLSRWQSSVPHVKNLRCRQLFDSVFPRGSGGM